MRVQPAPSTGMPALDSWLRDVERFVNTRPSDTTTTTLTASDSLTFHTGTVFWNGSSAGTITLPSDATYYGAKYDVKNLSGHTVFLDPAGSVLIEGNNDISLVTANWSYSVSFDGTAYRIL